MHQLQAEKSGCIPNMQLMSMQADCMLISFRHVLHWLQSSTPMIWCVIQAVNLLELHATILCGAAGTLLCVLLPPLTVDSDQTRNSKVQTVVTSAALPRWVIAAVTTATGRVLGDAHWVSDTMAGACLGASLVSVTTILCSKLAADVKQ